MHNLGGAMSLDKLLLETKPRKHVYKPKTLLWRRQYALRAQSALHRLTLAKRKMFTSKQQSGNKSREYVFSKYCPSVWQCPCFVFLPPGIKCLCLSWPTNAHFLLSNIPFRYMLWSVRTKISRKRPALYLFYCQSRNITEFISSSITLLQFI